MSRTIIEIIPDRLRVMATDDLNWTLQELKEVKKGDNAGKVHWLNVSYHANPGAAAMSAALRVAQDLGAVSLRGFLDEFEAICDEIVKTVNDAVGKGAGNA